MVRRVTAGVLAVCAAFLTPSIATAAVEDRATWQPVDPLEPAKACPRPVWPAASVPGQGRRVLVLGDSLTKYAYRPLAQGLRTQGWLPTIICWGGSQTDWGLKQAKDVSRRTYLPDRVVVAFGTNDVHKNPCAGTACREQVRAFGRRVENMLDYLGPQRQVWWLNIDMNADRAATALGEPWNRNYPAFNRELSRRARPYPNVTVIDWHSIVTTSAKPVRYSWDGLHYDPIDRPRASTGTMLRVRTIVGAVSDS